MIEILSAKTLAKIPFYDKPPQWGGQRSYLTPAELGQKFGITFSEGMYAADEEVKFQLEHLEFEPKPYIDYSDIQQQLDKALEQPFDGLCIASVNNSKVGFSVFAEKDISEGTVLGIYPGVVTYPAKMTYSAKNKVNLIELTGGLSLTDNEVRGFAGFMQHLPRDHDREYRKLMQLAEDPIKLAKVLPNSNALSAVDIENLIAQTIRLMQTRDTELANIEFLDEDSEVRNSIASANIEYEVIPYKGIYVIAVITKYSIGKGEIVGRNFSKNYLIDTGKIPELFWKSGMIVPRDLYKRHGTLHLRLRPDGGASQDRQAFLKVVADDKPIFLKDNFVSIYDVREELVRINAVGTHYGSQKDNSTALQLRNKFKRNKITVGVFWHSPTTDECPGRKDSTDIVCHAQNPNEFTFLTDFFKPISKHTKQVTETGEFVLLDVDNAETRSSLEKLLK